MHNLHDISKLSYLTVTEYSYKNQNIVDFRNIPRPHFCMGLVLEGSAEFCYDDVKVNVKEGEIIFVPLGSCYRAVWSGSPNIRYISMHFSFDPCGPFTREQIIKIQKIIPNDLEKLKNDFLFAYQNQNSSQEARLKALSVFFSTLSEILPKLVCTYRKKTEKRIERAIDYITRNFNRNISINELSAIANMSTSYFLSRFHSETGYTVTEFKNKVRIDRALLLLIDNENYSVEEISSLLGFESAIYFRRVFKKNIGKTPTEYRKTAVE